MNINVNVLQMLAICLRSEQHVVSQNLDECNCFNLFNDIDIYCDEKNLPTTISLPIIINEKHDEI